MKGLKELNALREAHDLKPIDKPFVPLFHPDTGSRCFTDIEGKPVEWFASRGQLSDEAREERRPPSPAEQLEMNHEVLRPVMKGRPANVWKSSRDVREDLFKILGNTTITTQRFDELVDYVRNRPKNTTEESLTSVSSAEGRFIYVSNDEDTWETYDANSVIPVTEEQYSRLCAGEKPKDVIDGRNQGEKQ